jgi:SAM-dependent methyltransferase
MNNLKEDFRRHLVSIGYEPDASQEVIYRRLREHVGEKRFAEIFQDKGARSAQSHEEFYSNFEDLIEGNLMRSLDPSVTLDASFELYGRSRSYIGDKTRVVELGCWTGGLASFIAIKHPKCHVTGVDAARNIVDACKRHYHVPNLDFEIWNYRWAKPETILPADVLLCSMGVVHHMPNNETLHDPMRVRGSKEYSIQRDHAIGYFGQWRTAANPCAKLFAVLRLKQFPRFLAWIDAAHACGWSARLNQFWRVELAGEKSVMPGLVFEATDSPAHSEEEVLDRWAWFNHGAEVYAKLEGAEALAAYRGLDCRNVLGTRRYRTSKGLLTGDEVGEAKGIGYILTYDAVSQYRLLLVSHEQAKRMAAGVKTPGSETPIADNGAFDQPKKPDSIALPSPFGQSLPFFGGNVMIKAS